MFRFSIRTIPRAASSQIQLFITVRAIGTVMCVRDGETVGPLGNTLEVTERVGASAGAHALSAGEQREQECRSQMQGWKQSRGIDWKRQPTEVAAASLALPGPLSSRPASEVQNHLLCMQGVHRRESGPDGMCSPDKMREKREREGRKNMRIEGDGSLFSDEYNKMNQGKGSKGTRG